MRQQFQKYIFNLILQFDVMNISKEIALRGMIQSIFDDRPTLVQVMVWCRQATRHYLSQRWPQSMSEYGVINPQSVKQREVNSEGHTMG